MDKFKLKYRFSIRMCRNGKYSMVKFKTENEVLIFLRIRGYKIAGSADLKIYGGSPRMRRSFANDRNDWAVVEDRQKHTTPFLSQIPPVDTGKQSNRWPY